MSDSCTIGQLARAANVPISTVRFYERTGLLRPDGRSEGNYRQYDAAALERLRFIRAAQATGFSIDDIRELLSLTHSDEPPCPDVQTLMTNRLAEVRERLKKLRHVERVLAKALHDCCNGEIIDLCSEITRLKGAGGKSCKTEGGCEPCKPSRGGRGQVKKKFAKSA
jgi:MerR family mercuric resistance operon transcriptional regulator